MGVRYVCIKRLAASCGENVAVFPHVTLKRIEKLHIGNNVSIHTMCYLDALGEIVIGDNVSIAHQSSLVSFDHMYSEWMRPGDSSFIIPDSTKIGGGYFFCTSVFYGA